MRYRFRGSLGVLSEVDDASGIATCWESHGPQEHPPVATDCFGDHGWNKIPGTTMSRSFDPYYRWLGIPPEEQPPHHYRLLGIQPFENDPGVIETAADRQMAHLRTFQTGPQAEWSQTLLNQVAAAKICLLNRTKKAAYDVALRRELEVGRDTAGRTTRGQAVGQDLTDLSPVKFRPVSVPASLEGKQARSEAMAILISMIAAGVLLVGGLVWMQGTGGTQPPTPKAISPTITKAPTSPQASVRPASPVVAESVPESSPAPSPQVRSEAEDVPQTIASVAPTAQAGKPHVVPSPQVPASPPAPGSPPNPATDGPRSVPVAKTSTSELPRVETPQKAPLPADAVQAKILADLEEVYRLSEANSDEERCRLARELVKRAKTSQDHLDERFVLLRRAMELASEGSDATLMLQAVEMIGADFAVDVLLVKQKVLTRFVANGSEPTRVPSFLENVDGVVDSALAEDRYALALELLSTAERLCQKPQGRSHRKRIHDRREEVQQLLEQWDAVQQAQATVKTNLTDAAAHLVLGRWYCLAKADWPQGLSYLAKGSDPALKALAEEELSSPPKDPEGQVKLADAWWEQAQGAQGESRRGLLRRAGHWYDQARPGLTGLMKTRVEKRLAEIAPGSEEPGTSGEDDGSGEREKAVGHLADAAPPGGERTAARMPGKVIPETIDQELRLPRQGGPYKLMGRVTITPQGGLLIERGTTILAAPGAAILAQGHLSSYGEGEGFVRFRPALPQAGWDKLALERASKQVLERLDVRGANRGLYIDEAVEVEIKDCLFLQNKVGVETKRNDKPLVRFHNCVIGNNASDGITLHLSHVTLDHCTVAHNGGIGINLAYYGNLTATSCHLANNAIGIKSSLYEGHVVVRATNLVNHRGAVIEVKTPQDYECVGNYWGTTNREQIALSIVDGLRNPGCGVVVFKGFLAKPVADAGCSLKVPKER